ncbi:hypothetical protein TNCV_989631 [Trichonephila clavipes]|nr:hypothetical protein TNCV_989631 [Trichonephila clavipes]
MGNGKKLQSSPFHDRRLESGRTMYSKKRCMAVNTHIIRKRNWFCICVLEGMLTNAASILCSNSSDIAKMLNVVPFRLSVIGHVCAMSAKIQISPVHLRKIMNY